MSKSRQPFNKYISDLRKKRKFTLSEVARKISNISISSLKSYESGNVNFIEKDKLASLARVYGIAPSEIFQSWVSSYFGEDIMVDSIGMEIVKEHKLQVKRDGDPRQTEIDIIALSVLKELQADLNAGDEVWVVAEDFLDDDIYYDMVVSNLAKEVIYRYFFYSNVNCEFFFKKYYKRLEKETALRNIELNELVYSYWNLDGAIANMVLHIQPKKQEGFIGMIHDKRPIAYQIASTHQTNQIFAFCAKAIQQNEITNKSSQSD